MNRTSKAVNFDLNQAALAIEDLEDRLTTMSLQDKIDTIARCRKAMKVLVNLDEVVKKEIKEYCKDTAGVVEGHKYMATLSYSEVMRLNQTKLKEGDFEIWNKYREKNQEGRVNFAQKIGG